ncbi:MAG: RNA polymerase sporulation sigma factor SigK [Clostridia bacterium]|nr:RNA polymerase sporulation sigma factor SigK [Clostridia bacterium]
MFNWLNKFFHKVLGIHTDELDNLVLYLSNHEALPSPMDAELELQYITRWQNQHDVEAKNKLIEHNLRLVVYIAKKFENTATDLDDLISIGSIGLIKAVNTFNTDKKIKLATYASRCIENEILMHIRKTSKLKNEISLDKPLSFDADGNELLLADILGMDCDEAFSNLETQFENETLYLVLDKLDAKDRGIMAMRFGLDGCDTHTQREVAEMLHISQSYISRIEKKILNKLKKNIAKINNY